MEWNMRIFSEIEKSTGRRRIDAHGQRFFARTEIREPIFPRFLSSIGGDVDPFETKWQLYRNNKNTCINNEFNRKFKLNKTVEERTSLLTEYFNFLKESFSYSDSNYFNETLGREDIFLWFLNSYDALRVSLSSTYIETEGMIYRDVIHLTDNSRKNYVQFLTGVREVKEIPNWAKGECLYVQIIEDRDNRVRSFDGFYISEDHQQAIDLGETILSEITRKFLHTRIYEPIPYATFVIINTYRRFMLEKLSPFDRKLICLLGGLSKSIWGVSITTDADYIILVPQEIDYRRYRPNVLVPGVYDDFGYTFYHDELFYCPENDKNYEERQKLKISEFRSEFWDGKLFPGEETYAKDCSGLRINRYFNYFKHDCNLFLKSEGTELTSIDDIPLNMKFHYNLFGMKFMRLDFEIVRDEIKTIDMGRVSKKQMYHFHNIQEKYGDMFNYTWLGKFFSKDTWCDKTEKRVIEELYHGDTRVPYVKRVVIRKPSKLTNEIVAEFFKDYPAINVSLTGKGDDYMYVYENVYLSSIPKNIDPFKTNGSVMWIMVVLPNGKINAMIVSNLKDITTDLCKEYKYAFIVYSGINGYRYTDYLSGCYSSIAEKIYEFHLSKDFIAKRGYP